MYIIPPHVLTAHLTGEAVVLHMHTKRYYRLNDTGASIWQAIEQGLGREEILARLCDEFSVEPDEAAAELDRIVRELAAESLLTTGDEPAR
ncbi:MAG TPA: PqqD family protein [Gemmatimonadaceae bacterium]|nr:PqqD family protein [Gemmatimonadaceae bacterium]